MARHAGQAGRVRRMAAGLALACLLGWPCAQAWAQAPPAAPGAAPAAAPAGQPGAAAAAPAGQQGAQSVNPLAGAVGTSFARLTLLTLDQFSYTVHPAAAITGDTLFDNGHAAFGSSFSTGAPSSDHSASLGEQLFHSLPPFGVEWGQTLGFFLPKAYSLGFDYYALPQTEESIAASTKVPALKLDTYLYNFALRMFFFDPTQPGINYFIGVGFGFVQGKLTDYASGGPTPEVVDYSQYFTGSTRLGLEAKGQNFGMRYELTLQNADQVKLDKNPYSATGPTTVSFSGTLIRIAMFYQF